MQMAENKTFKTINGMDTTDIYTTNHHYASQRYVDKERNSTKWVTDSIINFFVMKIAHTHTSLRIG